MNKDQLKILTSILFYLVITFSLHPIVGNMVGMFILIPIITGAWVFGRKGGLIMGIALFISNFLLLKILSDLSTQDFIQMMMGGTAAVIVGYSIGYTRDKLSELENLSNKLTGLKLGVERSNDIIFITDTKGIITYTNPAFTKAYGYTEEDWKGKTPRILKSGVQNNDFYKNLWAKLTSKKVMDYVVVNKTKVGKLLTIESSASPIVGDSGELLGFLAIQRNVTDKKRTDEILMHRANELEKMNELMVDRELKMIELKEKLKNKTH